MGLQQEDWDELQPLPQHRREPQYNDDASHAFSLDSSTCEMTPEIIEMDSYSNNQAQHNPNALSSLKLKETELDRKELDIDRRLNQFQKQGKETSDYTRELEEKEKFKWKEKELNNESNIQTTNKIGINEQAKFQKKEQDLNEIERELDEKNNKLSTLEKDLEKMVQEIQMREEECKQKEKDFQEELEKLELKEDDLNMKEAEFVLKVRDWENKSQISNRVNDNSVSRKKAI